MGNGNNKRNASKTSRVIIMASKAYEKGYRFERYIFSKLSESGFYCVRSAGSHGVFDIIAIYHGRVFGIQCKLNGQITNAELRRMLKVADEHKIMPVIAQKYNRKTVLIRADTFEKYDLKSFIHAVKKMEIWHPTKPQTSTL